MQGLAYTPSSLGFRLISRSQAGIASLVSATPAVVDVLSCEGALCNGHMREGGL